VIEGHNIEIAGPFDQRIEARVAVRRAVTA